MLANMKSWFWSLFGKKVMLIITEHIRQTFAYSMNITLYLWVPVMVQTQINQPNDRLAEVSEFKRKWTRIITLKCTLTYAYSRTGPYCEIGICKTVELYTNIWIDSKIIQEQQRRILRQKVGVAISIDTTTTTTITTIAWTQQQQQQFKLQYR